MKLFIGPLTSTIDRIVYVGIQDTSGNMLITLNNYAEFENIMLDKPEGM